MNIRTPSCHSKKENKNLFNQMANFLLAGELLFLVKARQYTVINCKISVIQHKVNESLTS